MIETRHGLESNPVPTSIFAPQGAMMAIKLIYLARVELVKLSEMLEKAYIPRRSEFGGFLHARDIRAIPTCSLTS